MSPKLKGIFYTLASAAMVSVTFIASKQALKELEPLSFTPIWFGIASLWGLSYYAVQPNRVPLKTLKPHWKALTLIGLFSSASNFFFFTSIKLGEPTIVSFFSRSETIFSLLWGIVLLEERLSRWQWLGAGVAVTGAGMMTYHGGAVIWTILLLTLIANFFNSGTSLVAKLNVQNVPANILGLARTLGLTVVLGTLSLFSGKLVWPSTDALLWMVGGSFFGPFLSFVFYYQGLKTVDMGQASILRATQPLFVALYSLALFGSVIGSLQFTGGLIILAGVMLMLSAGSNKLISSMTNPLMMFKSRKNRT